MDFHLAYPVTLTPASDWEPDETGFVVTFQDVPEAITQGEDLADALEQAADALEEAIAGRIHHGEDIPEPSAVPGAKTVPVPVDTALKAALHIAMREAGMTNVALAAKLGTDEKEIRRWLDPKHGFGLSGLEAALKALGKRVTIVIEDAT